MPECLKQPLGETELPLRSYAQGIDEFPGRLSAVRAYKIIAGNLIQKTAPEEVYNRLVVFSNKRMERPCFSYMLL